MAVSEWHDGLAKSDMHPDAVRHIINLETAITDKYNSKAVDFADRILETYRSKKNVTIEDLLGSFQHHFTQVMDDSIKPFEIYYQALMDLGRDTAKKRLGFDRAARRRMKLAAIGDNNPLDRERLDESFGKVKTVGTDIIDELKSKWVEQGGPNDLTRQFLLDQESKLQDENLTRVQMRQKLIELWHKQRYLIERIVRTETSNSYAKVQLQEWYDQGVREVERVEINDLKTCPLCKTLCQSGNNVFKIEDLLNDSITGGYPVTYISHPNCRGGYRPRINLESFEDFERELEQEPKEEFTNSSDVETADSKAENVPIEYQEQVQHALQDFGPDYGIKFVPEITETPEWQADRMDDLLGLYPQDEAKSRLEMEKTDNRGLITQYTTRGGTVLVSGTAGDVNRVVVPILRQHAEQEWLMASEDQRQWVKERFNQKISEKPFILEHENVELVGDNPFVSPLAGQSPEDYFVESYTNYVADPIRLLYLDESIYDFLRDNFMNREYLERGGIN
jgi:SPP1 gp7 family putative phage head morphogenesis protein